MIDDPHEHVVLPPARPNGLSTVVVEVRPITCPACGGERHRTTRSVDDGDDGRLTYRVCIDCDHRFRVRFVRPW